MPLSMQGLIKRGISAAGSCDIAIKSPVRTARAAPTLEALGTHLHVPQDFAKRIYALLTPGTTVVVTDLPGVRDPDEGRVRPVLESATR